MGDGLRFDYYYGIEAEQFSFYRVPRLLIKDSTNKVIGFPSEKQINKELTSVSDTISGLTKNITNNRTDIEILEAWVVSPLNTAEIESAFV